LKFENWNLKFEICFSKCRYKWSDICFSKSFEIFSCFPSSKQEKTFLFGCNLAKLNWTLVTWWNCPIVKQRSCQMAHIEEARCRTPVQRAFLSYITRYITRALHVFDHKVYIILNYCLILEKGFVNDLKLDIIYKFSCRKCYFLNV